VRLWTGGRLARWHNSPPTGYTGHRLCSRNTKKREIRQLLTAYVLPCRAVASMKYIVKRIVVNFAIQYFAKMWPHLLCLNSWRVPHPNHFDIPANKLTNLSSDLLQDEVGAAVNNWCFRILLIRRGRLPGSCFNVNYIEKDRTVAMTKGVVTRNCEIWAAVQLLLSWCMPRHSVRDKQSIAIAMEALVVK